jgi:hypothetical protein
MTLVIQCSTSMSIGNVSRGPRHSNTMKMTREMMGGCMRIMIGMRDEIDMITVVAAVAEKVVPTATTITTTRTNAVEWPDEASCHSLTKMIVSFLDLAQSVVHR